MLHIQLGRLGLSVVSEKGAQALAAMGMPEFTQGSGFDLANTLAGEPVLLPDFFQRHRPRTHPEAVAPLEH